MHSTANADNNIVLQSSNSLRDYNLSIPTAKMKWYLRNVTEVLIITTMVLVL